MKCIGVVINVNAIIIFPFIVAHQNNSYFVNNDEYFKRRNTLNLKFNLILPIANNLRWCFAQDWLAHLKMVYFQSVSSTV